MVSVIFGDDNDVTNYYGTTAEVESCSSRGGLIVLQNASQAKKTLAEGDYTPIYDLSWLEYLSCIPWKSDWCQGRKWGYFIITMVTCEVKPDPVTQEDDSALAET